MHQKHIQTLIYPAAGTFSCRSSAIWSVGMDVQASASQDSAINLIAIRPYCTEARERRARPGRILDGNGYFALQKQRVKRPSVGWSGP